VVSVGRFESGTAFNIIAEKAHLIGTTRSLDASIRQQFPHLIETVVDGICRSQGATYRFDYKWGYPALENDPAFTQYFRAVAEDILGPERVVTIDEPTMGGEDMAFFLQRVPGTFFALGSGTEAKGTTYPHHSPRFNFDEEVMWIGAALFAETAIRWLNRSE